MIHPFRRELKEEDDDMPTLWTRTWPQDTKLLENIKSKTGILVAMDCFSVFEEHLKYFYAPKEWQIALPGDGSGRRGSWEQTKQTIYVVTGVSNE